VRKKRTGGAAFRPPRRPKCSRVSKIAAALMNRRKGNPSGPHSIEELVRDREGEV